VLASPLIGNSVFSMRTSTATLSWEYMASGGAQLLVGAICFAAATRKYRRADAPAFGYDLGLIFLAAWVALSMLGLHYWDSFDPSWLRTDTAGMRVRFIATLLVSLLVALIPTTGAARAEVKYNRRLHVGDTSVGRRPFPPLIVAIVAAALPLLVLHEAPPASIANREGLWRTTIVFASFILSMSFIMRMIRKEGRRVWLIPSAALLIIWAIPVLGDLMYHGLMRDEQRSTGIITTFSPAGALFEIWNPSPSTRIDTTIGLAVQAGLALTLGALFYLRKAVTSPPASPPFPTPSSPPANSQAV
jgi:hypothetical protein